MAMKTHRAETNIPVEMTMLASEIVARSDVRGRICACRKSISVHEYVTKRCEIREAGFLCTTRGLLFKIGVEEEKTDASVTRKEI